MTLPPPDAWPVDEPLEESSSDLLRERAASTPEATAIVETDEGQSWTYG